MPLHPDYDLVALRAEVRKVTDKIEQRRVFIERIPSDAREAIAAHSDAIRAEENQLTELQKQITVKLAESEALKNPEPAEEAQPAQ